MNVQRFKELKRVLSSVPEGQLDMTNWNSCACGHATRDEWFRSQGLTTCTDFPTAAAFFEITRGQATRKLEPGMPATTDLREDRLNLQVDGQGVVNRVTCG